MPSYRIFGLVVDSDFALPLVPLAEGPADVEIRRGGVPTALRHVAGRGACFEAGPREALIHIPPVGRFHVVEGERISVEPAAGLTDDHLPSFLLNLCLGVLLQQRGVLVLHAAAVEVGDRCVALAGVSGAGKSTLAALLHARGHRVLTDEICLVETDSAGEPQVTPGPPVLQLWRDATGATDVSLEGLDPARPGSEKYFLPLGDGWCDARRPLDGIYRLCPWNRREADVEALTGQHRFHVFARSGFQRAYLEPMGMGPAHFRHLARLAEAVPGTRLFRPSQGGTPQRLAELLLEDLAAASRAP